MSKAFTKEDDQDSTPVLPPPVSLLPLEAKNYLAAKGANQLHAELRHRLEVEHPPLAALSDDRVAKHELAVLDQRIQYLKDSLRTAEIVDPPPPPHDIVRFGATVRVPDPQGEEQSYWIVWVDETDFARGWISWLSPLGRALLNSHSGELVRFKPPWGFTELTVTGITYE
jgi:transcription elongation factor GreB